MIQSIEQYLNQLKRELAESDSATIQDALSDAEEHLRTAVNSAIESKLSVSEADALPLIIEKYGLPADVALAYRELETHIEPAFIHSNNTDKRSIASRLLVSIV